VISTRLRAVGDPVPLCVKQLDGMNIELLRTGQPRGFDLQRGDWVAPAGAGVFADLSLQLVPAGPDRRSLTLRLRIPGEENGIQRIESDPRNASALKLPYHAPQSGYRSELTLPVGESYLPRLVKDQERQELDNYFLRVRGLTDDQGRFSGALYGKIVGPIRPFFDWRQGDRLVLYLHYYLNPTPDDTNLELDPSHNLFQGEGPFQGATTVVSP